MKPWNKEPKNHCAYLCIKIGSLLFVFSLMLIAGCIQQDIHIILHEDGSGEYQIKNVLPEHESFMLAGMTSERRKSTMQDKYGDLKSPGLKRVSYALESYAEDPSRFLETSIYRFTDLGLALPAMERVIPINVRYAYRNERFVIFRNQEKEKWSGMSGNAMKDAYLKVKIELPAKPISANGKVKGKTVSWHFDAQAVREFNEMDIGENFIEASIPASAIDVDLKPRLVKYVAKEETKERMKQNLKPIEYLNAVFPIAGEKSQKSDSQLKLFFSTEDIQIPFLYKNLEITSLIIDGKKIETDLITKTSGVYNGQYRYNRRLPWFLLTLNFMSDNPWMSTIDTAEIKMDVSIPSKRSDYPIKVTHEKTPRLIYNDPSSKIGKILLTEIDMGSKAMIGSPEVVFLTTASPNDILTIYLDTDYGLRYEPIYINWGKMQGLKSHYICEHSAVQYFGEKDIIYKCTVHYEKMPLSSFILNVITIDKKQFVTRKFKLENIDVPF